MQSRLFHLHALTALHCGTGQSAGVVDLPIARARATGLPVAPGSSIRGVLRDQVSDKYVSHLFGPREIRANEDAFAGALSVGDAHLLLLPVRALAGIVCYATSPFILRRYARDMARAELRPPVVPEPADSTALVTTSSVNVLDDHLVLEDLDPTAKRAAEADAWAEAIAAAVHPEQDDQGRMARRDLTERFAILPDSLVGFLAETATEVRARIRIDRDTGVVDKDKGALWYEENLPAEAVLWGVYALTGSNMPRNGDDPPHPDRDALARALPNGGALLQLGGKAGVGRGLVRFLTTEASA